MSVSIIIVNWNSGNLLRECLRHIHLQTILPEQVFVVENASTDGSGEIEDYSGRVTVLKMESNIGFAAGNNRALCECKTKFVALLNPDAFPEPEWLEQLLKAANKDIDSASFGSQQLCCKNSLIIDGIGDCYHMSGLAWRNRHGKRIKTEDQIACEIFSPCAAAAIYRRKALLNVGGFDEDYFCYSEDVDLGFRLRLAGYKSMYVPKAVVHHVGSATSGGQRSDFSVYYGHRNIVWTFVKNMPGALFWFLLPFHMLLNIVTIVAFAARGQFDVIFKAKVDAVKKLPHIWAKRKEIQKTKSVSSNSVWKAMEINPIPNKKLW